MFTAAQIAEQFGVTEAQASVALAGIDQEAIEAEEQAAYVWQRWDKVTAPNEMGVAPFLATLDQAGPDAEAYLIRDTRKPMELRAFQWLVPDAEGVIPMTAESIPVYAEPDRQRITNGSARARILALVSAALGQA